MRQILSLSLPESLSEEIKKNAKLRGFNSVSGYIKYLFDLDKDLISDRQLLSSVKEARKEYQQGETIKAKSLADLL
jgi:Arc/MetJ-type ribon-helix-helix transcriptional regulator